MRYCASLILGGVLAGCGGTGDGGDDLGPSGPDLLAGCTAPTAGLWGVGTDSHLVRIDPSADGWDALGPQLVLNGQPFAGGIASSMGDQLYFGTGALFWHADAGQVANGQVTVEPISGLSTPAVNVGGLGASDSGGLILLYQNYGVYCIDPVSKTFTQPKPWKPEPGCTFQPTDVTGSCSGNGYSIQVIVHAVCPTGTNNRLISASPDQVAVTLAASTPSVRTSLVGVATWQGKTVILDEEQELLDENLQVIRKTRNCGTPISQFGVLAL